MRRITVYTLGHFILAALFWFLSATVALGLGFKDELTNFEHVFSFVIACGVKVLAFPVWWLTLQGLSSWLYYLLIPLQLIVSFLQVNMVLLGWGLYVEKKTHT